MRSLVEDKVNKELAMDSVDDMLDHMHKEKVKALLDEFLDKREDLKELETELKKHKSKLTPGIVGES